MPTAAHCTLLRLVVTALLLSTAAPQRVNVQVSDRLHQEARSNEIDWESRRPRAAKVLSVGQPLTQQALKLGEDALRCSLAGLQPSTGYEVRVSYAGTVPAAVHLAFSHAGSGAPRRVLLDVEKLVFETDASGMVAGAASARRAAPEVVVTAKRAGAHAMGPNGGGGFVLVDVALSPLLGGLPMEAQQLGPWLMACAALVALAMFAVPVGGLARHPAQRFWDRRAGLARVVCMFALLSGSFSVLAQDAAMLPPLPRRLVRRSAAGQDNCVEASLLGRRCMAPRKNVALGIALAGVGLLGALLPLALTRGPVRPPLINAEGPLPRQAGLRGPYLNTGSKDIGPSK